MNMEEIEQQLRKQAQILGDLNMQLNKCNQLNQSMSLQIKNLENKIIKKRKIIDQQNKDKQIIHQKLIAAQNRRQVLQIQSESTPKQDPEQNIEMGYMKRPSSLNVEQKPAKMEVDKKIDKQQKSLKDSKKVQQSVSKKSEENQFNNPIKGEYQPPALFFGDSKSDDEDENEDEMLEAVRKKLQNNQVDDDDDD